MEQLKFKDEEYVKALKKQNDDIDDLIKSMQDQYIHMSGDYNNNLQIIETSFGVEREKILKNNKNEI